MIFTSLSLSYLYLCQVNLTIDYIFGLYSTIAKFKSLFKKIKKIIHLLIFGAKLDKILCILTI